MITHKLEKRMSGNKDTQFKIRACGERAFKTHFKHDRTQSQLRKKTYSSELRPGSHDYFLYISQICP